MFERLWQGLLAYADKLRHFQPNARLYLANIVIAGAAFGIFRLLFNFYVLSLGEGYDEALLGQLVMVSSLASMIGAFPAGYLSDRIGRKASLVLSSATVSASVLALVFWHTRPALYLLNAVIGLAQSLGGVSSGPFLMENSGEKERTYLFSFNAGLQTLASSVGNVVGGLLPAWLGGALGVAATSSAAYGVAIAVVGGVSILALLPLVLLKRAPGTYQVGGAPLSPFQYLVQHPGMLLKLIGPQLVISVGAGLLMPFMNVFFRKTYQQADATIGTLFALGSLTMGIGLIVAPPLADRWGKTRFVVITQALSIPFLVLLGFAPWFWLSAVAYLVRVALMNMSNPIYSTFVMEQVESRARATVASLSNMSWSVGWLISPWISGQLQVHYGFAPVYAGTISTYVIGIFLMWLFFVRKSGPRAAKAERITGPSVQLKR